MESKRPDPVETAAKALRLFYPGALGGFAAGSVLRGEGTPTSDIDIAVMFDESFEDVHRDSKTVDGWPIEFFVHNPKAQLHFFERDRKRGMCVMPSIIGHGVMIPSENDRLREAQERALTVIAAGPEPLSTEEKALRRYVITDLLDDLVGAQALTVRHAILCELYPRVGDFHLRAALAWSGVGKALNRCLHRHDNAWAASFETAFAKAFAGDIDDVVSLVGQTLAPYGGLLREGYRAQATDEWRK